MKLLIIAHYPFATAVYDCSCHLFDGLAENVVAYDVVPNKSATCLLNEIEQILNGAGHNQKWLIFVDSFGSTPGNLAQKIGHKLQSTVICGFNLAMLWEAMQQINLPGEVQMQSVVNAAKNSIRIIAPQQELTITSPKATRSGDD